MLYIFQLDVLTRWLYQFHGLYSVSFYKSYMLAVFKAADLLAFV